VGRGRAPGCECRLPGTRVRGGVPSATLAILRPLAAGSARRKFFLSAGHSSNRTTDNLQECPPASSTPPHHLGSPVPEMRSAAQQAEGERAVRPASRGPLPKRPCTERVDAPLPARRPTETYPLRYGEGGQRSRSGCSGPRMPGSSGNGPRETGAQPCRFTARRATNGAPLRGCGAYPRPLVAIPLDAIPRGHSYFELYVEGCPRTGRNFSLTRPFSRSIR